MNIDRRVFLKASAVFAAGAVFPRIAFSEENSASQKTFKIKFAPRYSSNIFRSSSGKGLLAQTQYFYDNGFRAVEGAVFFNHKPQSESQKEEQAALGEMAKKLGIEMGCISSMNDKDFPIMTASFAPDKKIRDKSAVEDFLTWQMEGTFEVMRRLGSKTFIIGAGVVAKDVPWPKQYDNTVENMAFCARHCMKNGVIMQIEPLNEKTHKNIFITNASLGAKICGDVNLPSCRLLYDIYHEHVQTGNNDALDDDNVFRHILSFHVADDPGRNEPGSGEIDFEPILKKIWKKGFRGIFGLEHGQTEKSKEGDAKLLETYRKLDACVS